MSSDFFCSACDMAIQNGESMWTVNIHEEVFDGDEITVLGAETFLTWCRDCQADFDFESLDVPRFREGDPRRPTSQ